MAKKRRRKKKKAVAKTNGVVTFISDYPYLNVVMKPSDFEESTSGRRKKIYGKYIKFFDGFYKTSDKAEIEFIKGLHLYRAQKIQIFKIGMPAPVIDKVKTIPGVLGSQGKEKAMENETPADGKISNSKVKIPAKK
ncbi:hypothetical protein LCGC14_1487330 [marine sediment metagenome]|uniref:Uncharacterized protein n=1 Tax=marine sediment metagenome TaxID=412755 RepID=A0A0F9J8I3_9ZZZZ